MDSILISGCGDIGKRVARLILAQSREQVIVHGLTRNKDTARDLENLGIQPVIVDLDDPATLKNLPSKDTTVFHLAPPPNDGQGENRTKDPRFRALLEAFNHSGFPKKVVLLSTTAVYGDCQGEWVDETAEISPQTDRGRRRLDAELALRDWAEENNVSYVILRVSGIYGPGRLPIERLKKSLPILREDLAPFSNRIHQDDLAMVCVAAGERAPSGAIYNVCDGHPSTMSHYFKSIATALDLPAPPEINREQAEKQLSAGMLSYLSESRRLSNKKMLDELGVTLKYPDLAAGLKDIALKNG